MQERRSLLFPTKENLLSIGFKEPKDILQGDLIYGVAIKSLLYDSNNTINQEVNFYIKTPYNPISELHITLTNSVNSLSNCYSFYNIEDGAGYYPQYINNGYTEVHTQCWKMKAFGRIVSSFSKNYKVHISGNHFNCEEAGSITKSNTDILGIYLTFFFTNYPLMEETYSIIPINNVKIIVSPASDDGYVVYALTNVLSFESYSNVIDDILLITSPLES